MTGDFGEENRLGANDGLAINQQLTADRGKDKRRPDQMMQPGGDQEPVEKAVQEDPDGAKRFHKAGQRRDAQLHHRPEIDGGDSKQAHQRQHHDQHQLAVAVDRQRAAKFDADHAIVNKGDSAAKDNTEEHAHIDDLKTEDIGLSAAIQLRVGGPGRQAMGQGQPAVVRRQVDQPGHGRHESGFGFAGFRQTACQPEAEQKPEIVHQRPEHAGDEFP